VASDLLPFDDGRRMPEVPAFVTLLFLPGKTLERVRGWI
jgi:hypothetical protein